MTFRRRQAKLGTRKLYKLIKPELTHLKIGIGRDKFFEILRKNKMLVKRKKKYVYTTNSFHRFHKYKNKFKGKLLTGPNQAWVSDLTYLKTKEGFMYLFLITDAYSRKIIGWSLSDNMGIESALKALKMALRQCKHTKGVIHHSDRGIQYCSREYTELLLKHHMDISMTEENHCYENAIAERVNGILKDEFYLDEEFTSKKALMKAAKEAINIYNCDRPHWSLSLSTPQHVHEAA